MKKKSYVPKLVLPMGFDEAMRLAVLAKPEKKQVKPKPAKRKK